MPCKLRFFSQF